MQNINYNFSIRCEKAQAEDFKKRAIALKDLGYQKQAKLFVEAASHAESKALILLRIENLRREARLGRRLRKENDTPES